jgi:SAM-dependent methyltransferase
MEQATASRASLKHLQQRPFTTFFCGLLNSKHFAHNPSAIIRILEVGSSSGEFLTLLKDELPALQIVAIDSDADALKEIPEMSGVVVQNVNFLDFRDEEGFDVVVFTKSLHHIFPLDKAVAHAYDLLKPKGFLVAEDFSRENMNKQLATWFFERAELLAAAGVFVSPAAGSRKHRPAHVFDSTLSPLDRWASFNSHHVPPLPGGAELIEAVTSRFGAKNTIVLDSIPFLYNYLCMLGLEDSPRGRSTMSVFLVQEENAIRDGQIVSVGLNIVAERFA